MKQENENFKKGDIVWAKVKGYPWWPGKIKKIFLKDSTAKENSNNTLVTINFIGDNSHSELPISKVENFEKKYSEYSNTKKKILKKSIEKAKRMSDMNKLKVRQNLKSDQDVNKEEKNLHRNLSSESSSSETSHPNDQGVEYQLLGRKKMMKSKSMMSGETCSDALNEQENKKDKPKNIKINININVTNNNHNTVNISSFNSNKANEKTNSFKDAESQKEPTKDTYFQTNTDNTGSMNDGLGEEESEGEEEDDRDLPDMKFRQLSDNLLKYQIELSSLSSKHILVTLNEIKEKLESNESNDLYRDTKDMIPVLFSLTYNKNNQIVDKSSEILSEINEKIIKDLFEMTQEDEEDIFKSESFEDTYNSKNDLMTMMNPVTPPIFPKKLLKSCPSLSLSKKALPRREFEGQRENGCKAILDDFGKIFKNQGKNLESEFEKLSEEFYSKVYNKHSDLDLSLSMRRKRVCIDMLSVLSKRLPKINKDLLKKIVIYFEYRVRNEDKSLGKKYLQYIGNLYIFSSIIFNQ